MSLDLQAMEHASFLVVGFPDGGKIYDIVNRHYNQLYCKYKLYFIKHIF